MAHSNSRSLILSSKLCRSCTPRTHHGRVFFSSSPYLQQTSNPRSPNFIEYPKAPQPDLEDTPPVKGVLPVPRNVFKNRGKFAKNSSEFLEHTTPEPSASKATSQTQFVLWKQRMAAVRRRNLREGISELSQRKAKTEKILSTKSLEKQHENRALLLSPEAEDERLTKASMNIALRNFLNGGAAPPKESAASVAERRERHKELQELKAQDRQNALHTLYMHAQSFITTEPELNKAIDEAFDETQIESWYDKRARNIWMDKGIPNTVQNLLRKSDSQVGSYSTAQGHMKKIAESLSSGKN